MGQTHKCFACISKYNLKYHKGTYLRINRYFFVTTIVNSKMNTFLCRCSTKSAGLNSARGKSTSFCIVFLVFRPSNDLIRRLKSFTKCLKDSRFKKLIPHRNARIGLIHNLIIIITITTNKFNKCFTPWRNVTWRKLILTKNTTIRTSLNVEEQGIQPYTL